MSAPRSRTGADRGSERSGRLRAAALLLVLGVLVVRGIAFWRVPELTYDGTYYLRQAARLAHFHYEWIGFPPGYPLAVALVRLVARDAVLAGRLVSLLAGLVSLWVAHRLARRFVGPGLALLLTGMLAVHPDLARAQVETLSESLYMALTLGALLGFETRRDLLAGLLLGTAFLVRPEAMLLLGGLLVLRVWRDRRPPWRLAAGLLPVAAYAAVASHAVGHFVVSPKQGQFELGPAMLERLRTLGQVLHECFPVVLLPGALVAGWRRAPQFLLAIVYVATIPFFAVHVQERLLLPALPFLLLLGVDWAAHLRVPWRRPVGVASGLLFALGLATGWRNLVTSEPLTPHARELGAALRPHLQFESRVAGRFPLVPYFADAGFVRVPRTASCTVLLDSVRTLGATHLLVLESEMPNVLPQLRPLFDDPRYATAEGRLRPVARADRPAGARAILYEVVRPPLLPQSVQRAGRDVARVAWVQGRCLATTTAGDLVWLPAGEPAWPAPGPVRDLAVDDAQTRLASTLGSGTASVLATLDFATGTWTTYGVTAGDAPASPTFATHAILYVAGAPPGLRALDMQTGRVHHVELAGVTAAVATPERVSTRGAAVAITYIAAARPTAESRVVATAVLPARLDTEPIVLQGRWASQVRLYDPATCWSTDGGYVLASVLVTDTAGTPLPEHSSLCLLLSGGSLRRLSYDLAGARRPAIAAERIAFVCDDGAQYAAPLRAATLVVPAPLTFDNVLAPSLPAPHGATRDVQSE